MSRGGFSFLHVQIWQVPGPCHIHFFHNDIVLDYMIWWCKDKHFLLYTTNLNKKAPPFREGLGVGFSPLPSGGLGVGVRFFQRCSSWRLFRCLKGYLLRAESCPFARWNVMFWRATAILIDSTKVQKIFETTKYLLYFLHYKSKIIYIVLIIRHIQMVRMSGFSKNIRFQLAAREYFSSTLQYFFRILITYI